MNIIPDEVAELTAIFKTIQGVGEKTAHRYSLHFLERGPAFQKKCAEKLLALNTLLNCCFCGMIIGKVGCAVCSNSSRVDQKQICVIENVGNLLAIENGGYFKGRYCILGGVLDPLRGIGVEDLRFSALMKMVMDCEISEVILAITPSIEGEATMRYIQNMLPKHVKILKIAQGIPFGGQLEHMDPLTLMKAIENRTIL